MSAKTIILIAWPVSVLLALFLGVQWGTAREMEVGLAGVYKDRVTRFQADVGGFANGQDRRTANLLIAVSILAGAIVEPERYDELRAEAVMFKKHGEGDPNAFPRGLRL